MAFSFQVVVTLLSTSHRCRPPCDEAFEGERADRGVVYVTGWFDSRAVTRPVTPRPGTVGTSRNQRRSGFGDDHAFPRGWRVMRGGPTGRQGLAYRHTGSSDESRDDRSRTARPPRPGQFLSAARRACPIERATSAIASRRRPLGSTSLVLRRSRREADNDSVRVSPATFDARIGQPRFRLLDRSPGASWLDASQGARSPRRQYRAFAA